jgi:uncharacterized protein DUF6650
MTFKEVASKITGFSFPIFGISWNPSKPEIEIAKKVMTFLEDRRVLYVVYELESPQHCAESVIKIREFLTEQLFDLKHDSELSKVLRAMRSCCRKFLDEIQKSYYYEKANRDFGMGEKIHFYNEMGELRATMGILIAKILVMHGLDFEGQLIEIIPFEIDEE